MGTEVADTSPSAAMREREGREGRERREKGREGRERGGERGRGVGER